MPCRLWRIVTLIAPAVIYAFERELPDGTDITDYGTALWWTATLATFFIDSPSERLRQPDAENDEAELAGAKSIQALQVEITALRAEI